MRGTAVVMPAVPRFHLDALPSSLYLRDERHNVRHCANTNCGATAGSLIRPKHQNRHEKAGAPVPERAGLFYATSA